MAKSIRAKAAARRTSSAKRKTNAPLARREERYKLAIESTDAGVYDWDLRSGSIYISPVLQVGAIPADELAQRGATIRKLCRSR
jgi:hypothetical protein